MRGFGQSVIRAYHSIALLVCNTLLLLIAVVLLCLLLPKKTLRKEDSYSSKFILSSYHNLSPPEAKQLGSEFDEMQAQESYAFDPWAQFRERPFHGRLLNVDDNGLRRTVEEFPEGGQPPLDEVWFFGGSTMFGWGVDDKGTIPSQVALLLKKELPNDRGFSVKNYGHSYYYSSQELAYFLAVLRRAKRRPSAVVFLDGLNDAVYISRGMDVPYFSNVAKEAWERERGRLYAGVPDVGWFTINRSFPVTRLTDLALALMRRREPDRSKRDALVSADISSIEFNVNSEQALGAANQFKVVNVLQPINRTSNPPSVGKVFDAIKVQSARLKLLDISDIFLGKEGRYVDSDHYSDLGCAEIAREISKSLFPLLATGPKTTLH